MYQELHRHTAAQLRVKEAIASSNKLAKLAADFFHRAKTIESKAESSSSDLFKRALLYYKRACKPLYETMFASNLGLTFDPAMDVHVNKLLASLAVIAKNTGRTFQHLGMFDYAMGEYSRSYSKVPLQNLQTQIFSAQCQEATGQFLSAYRLYASTLDEKEYASAVTPEIKKQCLEGKERNGKAAWDTWYPVCIKVAGDNKEQRDGIESLRQDSYLNLSQDLIFLLEKMPLTETKVNTRSEIFCIRHDLEPEQSQWAPEMVRKRWVEQLNTSMHKANSPCEVGESKIAPGGLGLFATSDIKFGQAIAVEQPFMSACVRPDGCDNCGFPLGSNKKAVACKGCDKATYCNQKCADQAHNMFHAALCGIDMERIKARIRDMVQTKTHGTVAYTYLFALKLIAHTAIRSLLSTYRDSAWVEDQDGFIDGIHSSNFDGDDKFYDFFSVPELYIQHMLASTKASNGLPGSNSLCGHMNYSIVHDLKAELATCRGHCAHPGALGRFSNFLTTESFDAACRIAAMYVYSTNVPETTYMSCMAGLANHSCELKTVMKVVSKGRAAALP